MIIIQAFRLNVQNNVEVFLELGNRAPRYQNMGVDMDASVEFKLDAAGGELLRMIVEKYQGNVEAYLNHQFESRVEEEILVRTTRGLK